MKDGELRRLGGQLWFLPHVLAASSIFVVFWFVIAFDPDKGVRLALAVLATCLVTAAGLQAFRSQLTGTRLTLAKQLCELSGEPSIIIGDRNRIVHLNKAMRDRLPGFHGETIEHLLGLWVATDRDVRLDLERQLKVADRAYHVAQTQTGLTEFSAKRMAGVGMIWTIQEFSKADLDTDLPSIIVGQTGEIRFAGGAVRDWFQNPLKDVTEIIEAWPLSNGDRCRIETLDGDQNYRLGVSSLSENLTQIMFFPAVAEASPNVEADWAAIEDLPVPLLKVSHEGKLLASNREARQLLGIASTQGRRLSDVLDGPGRPINDWLAQAMNGAGAHVSEFLRGRGEHRDTFVQVTLSTAGSGDGLHLIAVLNDVTELKTLEAQFVQSQKMQAIGQLAGGVAHDFNNLLTAISGHCDLLLLRHDEGHQNYADLIQIHQNTNRAASLVGQLLAFSRKQNLQFETIDLRDTLSDLTHLLNRLVGEKITLMLEHEDGLAPIRADRRQLEQVLMNLVVNARDAMQKGGKIRVVTHNLTLDAQMRKDRVVVPPGEYVVVNVVDEGSGITPEKLPKIFEPFFTTKRTGEGTGLGLSTVYGIVKQTGGYIFAESEVAKGTTFSLLFPKHDARSDEVVAVPRPPETPQLGGKAEGVVLLVEDESPVRAFASRALSLKGFSVLEAACAEAALKMLEDPELKVDVFVTDVIMPGLDGPTWVRQALKTRPETQVVFVSGYPEDAFEDGEAPIPNAVFLPKPFSLTALTQAVQGQLQGELEPA